ncbi:serine protease, partial [Acidimicrobiaceae bacterium USS-CC1]|nr:serine protease [Acidiferrimicrobium australe]
TGAAGGTPAGGLPAGGVLGPGQSIVSGNGQYQLSMLPSGDLVETSGTATLWSTSTASPGASALLDADGQLEVLAPAGTVVWSSPV